MAINQVRGPNVDVPRGPRGLSGDALSADILAGAQAAAAQAEAAASIATAAANGVFSFTLGHSLYLGNSVEEAEIPGTVQFIQIAGLDTVTDTGGGTYVRVDSAVAAGQDALRSIDRFLSDGSESLSDGGWWKRSFPSPAYIAALTGNRSIFEFMSPAKRGVVTDRSGLQGITDEWNNACRAHYEDGFKLNCPSGAYRLEGTGWLLPQGATFGEINIEGAGKGYSTGSVILADSFLNQPALNAASFRAARIHGFLILGGNTRYSATVAERELLYDWSGWIAPGVSDGQWTPYVGLLIDGGLGSVPPGGGYAGWVYRNTSAASRGLTLSEVSIRQFAVGWGHNFETGTPLQGDDIGLYRCDIFDNKINVGIGQSQARAITLDSCNLGWSRTNIDCLEKGRGTGAAPLCLGVQFGSSFEMIAYASTFGVFAVKGGRTESLHRIGQPGTGASSGGFPASIEDHEINLLETNSLPSDNCPVLWDAASTRLRIKGGGLQYNGSVEAEAYFIDGDSSMEDTRIHMGNRNQPLIGGALSFAHPASLKRVEIIDG